MPPSSTVASPSPSYNTFHITLKYEPNSLSTRLMTRFAKPYSLFDISILDWRRSLIICCLTGFMCNSLFMNRFYWCIDSSQAFESYLHALTWVASLPLVVIPRCIRPVLRTMYSLPFCLLLLIFYWINSFWEGGFFFITQPWTFNFHLTYFLTFLSFYTSAPFRGTLVIVVGHIADGHAAR